MGAWSYVNYGKSQYLKHGLNVRACAGQPNKILNNIKLQHIAGRIEVTEFIKWHANKSAIKLQATNVNPRPEHVLPRHHNPLQHHLPVKIEPFQNPTNPIHFA